MPPATQQKRRTRNRFKTLAGDEDAVDESELSNDSAADDGDSLASALQELASGTYVDETGKRHVVEQLSVTALAPHPWNSPARAQPQPGDPRWEALLDSVRAQGVRIPGLAVTTAALIEQRPHLAAAVAGSQFTVVYGTRRRTAALEAGLTTMPFIVDDSVLIDDQDLDLLTSENQGRKDLDPIEEAQLWATYATELELSQGQIGKRVGVDQATVARRLALLLLVPEVQQAFVAKDIIANDAVGLSGALPYGPARVWQKNPGVDQDTEQRYGEQLAALELIRGGWPAKRAADRIVAERRSREKAETAGVTIVDPAEQFGAQANEHRVFPASPEDAAEQELVGAIDPETGALSYYATSIAPATAGLPTAEPADAESEAAEAGSDEHSGAAPQTKAKTNPDARLRTAAKKARHTVAAKVAAAAPGKGILSDVLIRQTAAGVPVTKEALTLAHTWMRATGTITTATAAEWQAEAAASDDPKAIQAVAWAVAVAAAELRTDASTAWDLIDIAHVELLTERGSYEPTTWETRQIHLARRNQNA